MTDLQKTLNSKAILILFQLAFLSAFIYIFGYSFSIQFDGGIEEVQRIVIQFLANYVMFADIVELISIYYIWTVASLIPAFVLRNTRKAFFSDLTLFCLINFFFYIFLSRHSPDYYKLNSQVLIIRTIFLGAYISILSILFSQVAKGLFTTKEEPLKDIQQIEYKDSYACPHCGVEFGSLPLYCYNCLEKLDLKN